MAKKKPSRKPRKEDQITFRVTPEVMAALKAFESQQKIPPTRTAIMLRALEIYLKAEGALADTPQTNTTSDPSTPHRKDDPTD
jgi:hypothetical protein